MTEEDLKLFGTTLDTVQKSMQGIVSVLDVTQRQVMGLMQDVLALRREKVVLEVRLANAEHSINAHYSRCPMCVLAEVPKLGEAT